MTNTPSTHFNRFLIALGTQTHVVGQINLHLVLLLVRLHLDLLRLVHLVGGGSSDILHVVPGGDVSHNDHADERGKRREVVDPLLAQIVNGGQNQRRDDQRGLPEEVVVGQRLSLHARVRGALLLNPPRFAYANDRHGGGGSQTEANPQHQRPRHRPVLAVHRHSEIGEELQNHARQGEVGNRHLQRAGQPGVEKRLQHAAQHALNDDECSRGDGACGRLREDDRRRVEHGGEVNAVTRIERVHRPAETELEAEAEKHGGRDANLLLLQGLLLLFRHALLLLLCHVLLLLLRIDTLLSVLRRTTLKNDWIRLLEEQNCNNHRNTRSDTSDVARMNTQSKHLQREMIVDLTQNASKGGSDDERGSDARIQSR